MKIIAGSCRGMSLRAPKGWQTRPTSARVREAVMSMLAPRLAGAQVVDLFAGSGAIGLEMVSRGAHSCFFVEEDRQAIVALRHNIGECERRLRAQELPAANLKVMARPCATALDQLPRGRGGADVIWADPPYDLAKLWLNDELADKLCQISQAGSLFVLELAARELVALNWPPASCEGNWTKIKEKVYGETAIVIWQRPDEAEEPDAATTE